MTLNELEAKLRLAQEQMKNVTASLAYNRDWQKDYWPAHRALLEAEREVASAKGEPYAISVDFPVQWDTGAPLPQLIANDSRTFLTFRVRDVDPNWDGTYVNVKSVGDETVQTLALVDFQRCISVKMGSPNDEVFRGHPLSGKGMDGYSAQIVVNSPWLAEIETINKVHDGYSPERWRQKKHYIFWFHDSTFECIAESFTVELYQETMSQVLVRMVDRLDN